MSDTSFDVLLDGVLAAAKRGLSQRQVTFRPGRVASLTPTEQIVNVYLDGDSIMTDDGGNDDVPTNGWVTCQMLYGSGLLPDDRVMVMFAPPNGAFVVGRLAGDFNSWITVGTGTPAPAYASGWANGPDTGLPGETAQFQVPSFRRIGRLIELRGRAARTSPGGNPSTIFSLPSQYWPILDLSFPAICGPIAIPAFVIVRNTGEVQSLLTSGSNELPDGFINLDGIIFSTDVRPM